MKTVLLCLVVTSAIACDDTGSTSVTQSVPPVDLAAPTPAPTPATDMAMAAPTFPTTASVTVGPNNSLSYSPASVDIAAGGTVTWTWASGITMPHTVTSADSPPVFAGSPVQMSGTYSATFPNAGSFIYFCTVHGRNVMNGVVNVH